MQNLNFPRWVSSWRLLPCFDSDSSAAAAGSTVSKNWVWWNQAAGGSNSAAADNQNSESELESRAVETFHFSCGKGRKIDGPGSSLCYSGVRKLLQVFLLALQWRGKRESKTSTTHEIPSKFDEHEQQWRINPSGNLSQELRFFTHHHQSIENAQIFTDNALSFLNYAFLESQQRLPWWFARTVLWLWNHQSFISQGSKLATYMNRGGGGSQQSNFNGGGNSNSIAQMASELNSMGLDSTTLKKLSMTGIREFIPPSTSSSMTGPGGGSGMNMRGSENSGSNSPYQNFVPSSMSNSRLQPPQSTMNSYISPRGSPTPSSGSSSVMPNQADNGGDPSSISTYSDGGTTYFYSSDDVVRVREIWCHMIEFLFL